MTIGSKLLALMVAVVLMGAACEVELKEVPEVNQQAAPGLSITRRLIGANAYSIYTPSSSVVSLRLSRPDTDEKNVLLVVPGTYTSPKGTVEGYVIHDGVIVQAEERQGWNGALLLEAGRPIVIETNNGKLLTREYLKRVASRGGSLIQGHLLVNDGKPQGLRAEQLFQRRALAIWADGRFAVIESQGLIHLQQFANDLVDLKVNSAINLDMGGWSEGWYRNADDKVSQIGYLVSDTDKQTNWLVFEHRNP